MFDRFVADITTAALATVAAAVPDIRSKMQAEMAATINAMVVINAADLNYRLQVL